MATKPIILMLTNRVCPLCHHSWGVYIICPKCDKYVRLHFSPHDSEKFKEKMREKVKQQQVLGKICLSCKRRVPSGYEDYLIFCEEGEIIICPHCKSPVAKYASRDGQTSYVVAFENSSCS